MIENDKETVISYYNEHVQHKLNDYIKINPRIEEAWATLTKFCPRNPRHILEVGCGIGGVTYRMSNRWSNCRVTGIDISTLSIQVAQKLFAKRNTHFVSGILTPGMFDEKFDFIVLMDVYEHISQQDRPQVHLALKELLKNKGRIFLSVPTPHNLKWSAKHKPETMQPVDELISLNTIAQIAEDTNTEVILYEIKDVWNIGDYAHIVLEKNDDFEAAFFSSKPVTNIQRGKRVVNKFKYRMGSIFRKAFVKNKLR